MSKIRHHEFESGFAAARDGKGFLDNPYDSYSDQGRRWIDGLVAAMKPTEKNGPRDAKYTTLKADTRVELDQTIELFRHDHGTLEWGSRPSGNANGWTCRVRPKPP